jgi:hypothetical protein
MGPACQYLLQPPAVPSPPWQIAPPLPRPTPFPLLHWAWSSICADKCGCWYFIQILNYQLWIVRIFINFLVLFMASNIRGKLVSIQKK